MRKKSTEREGEEKLHKKIEKKLLRKRGVKKKPTDKEMSKITLLTKRREKHLPTKRGRKNPNDIERKKRPC